MTPILASIKNQEEAGQGPNRELIIHEFVKLSIRTSPCIRYLSKVNSVVHWLHNAKPLYRKGYHKGRAAMHAAIDLVIPPTCNYCRCDLNDKNRWLGLCHNCCLLLTRSTELYCDRCGTKFAAHKAERTFKRIRTCDACKHLEFNFSEIFTLGPYQNHLRDVVLQTKYPQGYSLAVSLGRMLARTQKKEIDAFQADLVVATPMHWLRRFQRGAHGPDAIANGMAAYLELPRANRLIIRSQYTEKQVALSQNQRSKNLAGAFRLLKKNVVNKRILLIDDVMTTGATCNEIAGVFRSHGAIDVAVAVVARQGLKDRKAALRS